jgi:uncharacterized protein DUF6984
MEAVYRPLKEQEQSLLKNLLETNFPGRDQLSAQVPGLLAKPIDEEGSLSLKVQSPVFAAVVHRVPVEASYPDLDSDPEAGPHVHILLHVVDGLMVELEIYKDDGSCIQALPDPDKWTVFTQPGPRTPQRI